MKEYIRSTLQGTGSIHSDRQDTDKNSEHSAIPTNILGDGDSTRSMSNTMQGGTQSNIQSTIHHRIDDETGSTIEKKSQINFTVYSI